MIPLSANNAGQGSNLAYRNQTIRPYLFHDNFIVQYYENNNHIRAL